MMNKLFDLIDKITDVKDLNLLVEYISNKHELLILYSKLKKKQAAQKTNDHLEQT